MWLEIGEEGLKDGFFGLVLGLGRGGDEDKVFGGRLVLKCLKRIIFFLLMLLKFDVFLCIYIVLVYLRDLF